MPNPDNPFPYARFWPQDANGFLINDTNLSLVPALALAVYEELKEFLHQNFADQIAAIYLRGSAACGAFCPPLSDLDFFVITTASGYRWETPPAVKEKLTQLAKQHGIKIECPFATACEGKEQWMKERPYLAAHLKCFSLLLAGKDFSKEIPAFTIGEYLAPNLRWYREDWAEFQQTEPTDSEVSDFCKTSLRVGFGLVMSQVGQYTNALQLCQQEISRFYPEQEAGSKAVLQLFVTPDQYFGEQKIAALKFWQWLANMIQENG